MTKYRYVTNTKVAALEKRDLRRHTKGAGDTAEFDMSSGGWWLVTEGPSPLSIRCGDEQPTHQVGDVCRIVVEFDR